jgi:hypothetical protein
MVTRVLGAIAVCAGLLLSPGLLEGQQKGTNGPSLTVQDRADIQKLVADYAQALGTCAAQEYATLFAAPDGFFASGPRGKVQGQKKLIELVESERHCNNSSERRPMNAPTAVVEPSADGAVGRAVLGTSGYYEDVFVKTRDGWRFASRTFISAKEEAVKFTAKDFAEIQQLAGNKGQYADVYLKNPEGISRFRSAGVVVEPSAEGATGRAYLPNNGGHYEDIYSRTADGWRLSSRTHVPDK